MPGDLMMLTSSIIRYFLINFLQGLNRRVHIAQTSHDRLIYLSFDWLQKILNKSNVMKIKR